MTESEEEDPGSRTEKRIGRRVPTPNLPLTLVTTAVPERRLGHPSTWRGRSREVRIPVEVLDLSVTGARVRTTRDVDLAPGSTIRIEVGTAEASALVRRREPGGGVEHAIYGIEFVDLREPLRSEFYGQVFANQPDLEELWNRSL